MTEFNHSFKEKVPPFERYNYIKMKDLERSPYVIWSKEENEWSKNDNYRMLLIALDRYADELEGRSMFKPGDKVCMNYMNYIVYGEVTITRKYESKVIFEGNCDLHYTYYRNTELKKV